MLGYQTAVSNMIDVNIRTTYNSSERDDLAEIIVAGVENTEVISFNSLDLEVLSTITPNNKINIKAGINYKTMSNLRDVIDAPNIGIINESFEIPKRVTQAVFSQINYQATDDLNLVAGLRYEDLQPYETNGITNGGLSSQSTFGGTRGDIQTTSPRLAAIYTVDTNHVVKFLYGEANRLGDDQLEPEITKTTEVNYIYSKNDFVISSSIFQNHLQDLVIKDLVFVNSSLQSRKRNGGNVTTNGIEIIINSRITDFLFGEFSLTLQDSTDNNNKNIEVGYSPRTIAHAKLAYKNNNAVISLVGRYTGSMETNYDLTKQNPDSSYGARVGDKIDDYFVLDYNFRQDKVYKSMYFNLKISNILNKEIRYPNNQETNELLDRGSLGTERTIIGLVGVKF
jgi:outer membrane receptor for ferrienterochelin and colicin